MATSPEERHLFGVPIEEYPEPCQSCAVLAEFAMLLDNPDLTDPLRQPFTDSKRNRMIARMVFPNLGECSDTCCGLRNAYAVQRRASLE